MEGRGVGEELRRGGREKRFAVPNYNFKRSYPLNPSGGTTPYPSFDSIELRVVPPLGLRGLELKKGGVSRKGRK
jgi:hypothetical protein